LIKHVAMYYAHYISAYQRSNVITWIKKNIEENFNFHLLTLLISYNAKISSEIIDNLCDFIREKLQTGPSPKGVQVFPKVNPFEELNEVGYWCFLKKLDKEPFAEFLGISDMFDFYYLFTRFDFAKFDVAWLLNTSNAAITAISKNNTVRRKIRLCISDALTNKQLSTSDKSKLSKILVEHFC